MPDSLQQRVIGALQPGPDWVKGDLLFWRPFDKSRFGYFVRFFGDRACKVNVQGAHNPIIVEGLLDELSVGDLPNAAAGQLIFLSKSPALEGTSFDLRAIVSPPMSFGALSKTTEFMAPVTFTAFPAYRCEFTDNDTRDELAFRLAKVVLWSDWGRQPSPAISARFHLLQSGVKSTGGKRMGVFPWAEIEDTLGYIAEEDGFIDLENFERRAVRIEHAADRFTIVSGGEPWHPAAERVVEWVRTYTIKGLDAANRLR
jgi:hypothetical protein